MINQPTTIKTGALPRYLRATSIVGLLPVLVLLLSIQSSHAGSATWKVTPATGDWNTATNWTAGGPPNGSADTATFATSNRTAVSISTQTEVDGIVFNPGASALTITDPPGFALVISGAGIANNSDVGQNFVTEGQFFFVNSASAGSGTFFTNTGGETEFFGTSTAGNGTFTNNPFGFHYGVTEFFQSSTAGNGIFTSNGGATSGELGGVTFFLETSTAGDSTLINNGGAVSGASGGKVVFAPIQGDGQTPTAGNATLIANGGLGGGAGGLIDFRERSSGGTARVELFGNGSLDISAHGRPAMAVGSIEGNGNVFLGARKLTVGSNNLSTIFSGVITDGIVGTGGSLSKIGKGKLSLTNANTYTGGTTITKGAFLAKNKTGSATGTGPVQVNAGTLGGTGKISGAVTIGNASTSGAILLPGTAKKPGTLTINSTLTFNALSTYQCVLNRVTTPTAAKVSALGVTINSGATFTFVDTTTGTLTTGTVFTVINNTSASPIAGTFSNLASGAVFASNGNNFQVSYTGGTGNDLTLTVQ